MIANVAEAKLRKVMIMTAQCTVATHVLLILHRVDDRSCTEEQVGLEHTMGQQVEDGEDVSDRAKTRGKNHVADLTHGRAGQRLLDVVLGARDDGPEEHGDHADDEYGGQREDGAIVNRVATNDEVDAGGDHGGGVDERGDRGGALHGVQQPGLQRELRGLARRGQQQQQTNPGQRAFTRLPCFGEDLVECHGAEGDEDQHDGQAEPDIADAVHHEGLLRGCRCARLPLPESNQQIGGQADTLPADVQQKVVVGKDQQEHRGDEEIEEAEEPATVGVVVHVADRVDEDQRSDNGDE